MLIGGDSVHLVFTLIDEIIGIVFPEAVDQQ